MNFTFDTSFLYFGEKGTLLKDIKLKENPIPMKIGNDDSMAVILIFFSQKDSNIFRILSRI